jgi:hypothetical protein
MKTIETNAVVTQTGKLLIQLQTDFSPGKYPVVLVIRKQPATHHPAKSLKFGRYAVGLANDDFSFRREELYARNQF